MTAISYVPPLPAPGRTVGVTFTFTQSGADYVRVWCTIAPTGSALDLKINSTKDPRNRVVVFEGAVNSVWNTTFDKGGKYTFVAQEYTKGSGYGGGYEGDPNTAATEAKLGSEATLVLYVGQRVTQPIGPPNNRATLVVWVWNDHIRATSKGSVGEESPAITAASPTPIVKTAIETTAVKTALTNLVDSDLSSTATTGDLETWTHSLYTAFNSHVPSYLLHNLADNYNALSAVYKTTPTKKSFQDFVNKALRALKQHVTNDGGAADPVTGLSGPNSQPFHVVGGAELTDNARIPLYESVGSFDEAYGGFVDLYRCFDAHQRDDTYHLTETSYVIHTRSLIMEVHYQFLTVLAAASPTVPPAQSTGVQNLISLAGFKE